MATSRYSMQASISDVPWFAVPYKLYGVEHTDLVSLVPLHQSPRMKKPWHCARSSWQTRRPLQVW